MAPAEPPVGPTEGELWAREELGRLRADRFSSRAIARFLAASQRRSAEVRRARPELARQSRAWSAAGAAAWALPAVAGPRSVRRRARRGLGWWGLSAVMLDWHLGMLETADGRPRPLGTADALTLARVWLAPVALGHPTPLVCAAGFATDVLDGVAARSLGEPTRAGRDLEGLADACFAAAVLVGLRRRGALGRTASAAELIRLGGGFGYALAVYFGRSEAPDPELTRAARLTTPVRAAGMLAAATGKHRLGTALVAAGCGGSLWLNARARFRTAGSRPGRSPTQSRR